MKNHPISEKPILPCENLLNQRELMILQLTANGQSAKEIGEQEFLSPRTVEAYRDDIRHKLGARSIGHAVAVGIRRGLIE